MAHEGATIIHVGWEEPDSDGGSAITGYKVEVSEDGLAYTDLLASTAHFHATQTGLEEGDTRYFRVKAINANGTGAAIIGSETTEEGVNLDLHGPWISAPTCDAGTTITIVDNTNTLQDVVISMDWEIEGVIENVEWFMDKYRGDSYLVLQSQIAVGRMELLLGVGEVRGWQRIVARSWRWPGGPRVLRGFMGVLRGGFTVRNPAGGLWSI